MPTPGEHETIQVRIHADTEGVDTEGALLGQFRHRYTDIYGNRGELIK